MTREKQQCCLWCLPQFFSGHWKRSGKVVASWPRSCSPWAGSVAIADLVAFAARPVLRDPTMQPRDPQLWVTLLGLIHRPAPDVLGWARSVKNLVETLAPALRLQPLDPLSSQLVVPGHVPTSMRLLCRSLKGDSSTSIKLRAS
jgi:hypothetical protein